MVGTTLTLEHLLIEVSVRPLRFKFFHRGLKSVLFETSLSMIFMAGLELFVLIVICYRFYDEC